MATKPSRKARNLVRNLIARAEDFAFIGSMHPLDRPVIKDDFKAAEQKLLDYIVALEAKP